LDAQAGQRRERQERDRRLDALAVDVLVALVNTTPRSAALRSSSRR